MASAARKLDIGGSLWFGAGGRGFAGHNRIELLRKIRETGSINRAAQSLGLSFKAAWQAVEQMNNSADQPLVVRARGGKDGGGTRLTEHGEDLVAAFEAAEAEHERLLRSLSERVADFGLLHQWVKRIGMRTSARNQFWGTVSSVRKGGVNGEVILDVPGAGRVVASITNDSVDALGLRPGREACAVIKASSVILALADPPPRTSARNLFRGRVARCIEGAVNGEVSLELGEGKTLTAVVTNASIQALGLREGVEVCALVKASSVIVAVNE
jgi:molybdate transport system regulatory protein